MHRPVPTARMRGMSGYAEVFVEFLPTEQGGRRTPVFLGEDTQSRYMPHFVARGGDGVYLAVEFVVGPGGPLPPGGSAFATVRFMNEPQLSYHALQIGAEFDIREGGNTVGWGRVTRR
jgi:hypothetical protein